MIMNFDFATFNVNLLSFSQDVIAAKSAFSFDCKSFTRNIETPLTDTF